MKAVSAQAKICSVYVKPKKIMQHMHGIIPFMFECLANPVAHLPPTTKDLLETTILLHVMHFSANWCITNQKSNVKIYMHNY